MPPLRTTGRAIILASALALGCGRDAAPTPPDPPAPVVRDVRVLSVMPGATNHTLVLSAGDGAGVKVGDKGLLPCHAQPFTIVEVFPLRSHARLDAASAPTVLPTRGRITLGGGAPAPWCP